MLEPENEGGSTSAIFQSAGSEPERAEAAAAAAGRWQGVSCRLLENPGEAAGGRPEAAVVGTEVEDGVEDVLTVEAGSLGTDLADDDGPSSGEIEGSPSSLACPPAAAAAASGSSGANSGKNYESDGRRGTGFGTENTNKVETAAAGCRGGDASAAPAALDIWRETTGPGETSAGHENGEHQLRHGAYMSEDPGAETGPGPGSEEENDDDDGHVLTVNFDGEDGGSGRGDDSEVFLPRAWDSRDVVRRSVERAGGSRCRDLDCPYNRWLYGRHEYPSRTDLARWEAAAAGGGRRCSDRRNSTTAAVGHRCSPGFPALIAPSAGGTGTTTSSSSSSGGASSGARLQPEQLTGSIYERWGGPQSILAPPYPALGVFHSSPAVPPGRGGEGKAGAAGFLCGANLCTSSADSTCSCSSCIELPDDPSAPYAFTVNNKPAKMRRSRCGGCCCCGHICCIVSTFVVVTLLILASLLLYLYFNTKVMTRGMTVS